MIMMMVTALMIVMKVHVRGNMSRSFIILNNFFTRSFYFFLKLYYVAVASYNALALLTKFHLFVRFCNCVSLLQISLCKHFLV